MMKPKWPVLLAGLAMLFAAAAASADDYPDTAAGMMNCPMMGMGSGAGPMMGGYQGMGPVGLLDLNDEQRAKVNKIHDDLRRQHWETLGKIMDEQAKLRDLYGADKRDTQAILKVHEQIDQLRRKMTEAHLKAENQMEAVLTKEQREQLRQMRRGRMHGMGPGGMQRGMMMYR